jgi:L-ascorbate metabolism protein UlaG (beta-lactamase superfamily)
VDYLFNLKSTPRPYQEIKEKLGLSDQQDVLMQSFLTEAPPLPYQPYKGSGIRWRYFGHACILIESQGISILVDPVLSYTSNGSVSRYTYLDLPDVIDYVLITHNHQDHVLFETMLQLRHKIKNIVVPRSGNGSLQDPSLKLILNQCGFDRVIDLGEFEKLKEKGIQITGLPFFGEHADLDIPTKLAWHVKIEDRSLIFVADSCNIEPRLYERIHQLIDDVEVLFIGMECDGAPLSWLYGSLLTKNIERVIDESRRLSGSNCDQGMRMIDCLQCKEVYVYAMGQEPWLNYIMSIKYTEESQPIIQSNLLIKKCTEKGIIAERLYGEKETLIEEPAT